MLKSIVKNKKRIFVFFIAILIVTFYIRSRAPSEARMIANFREHKAQFEQLRLMIQQDKRVRSLSSGWLSDQNMNSTDDPMSLGISKQRWARYQSLLKSVGADSISNRNNYIRFYVFGGGFTDTSWSIGYAWSAEPPPIMVESAYWHKPTMRDKIYHSRIENGWYIYNRR